MTPGSPGSFPSYAEIVAATDAASVPRGFLATEENFALVKELQRRNLIVPVVGDFAGPKAIRAVGKYLRARSAIVSAFYVSNVEQYLRRDGRLEAFCGSASTLPIDDRSSFIRSERGGFASRGGGVPTRRRPRRLWLQFSVVQHVGREEQLSQRQLPATSFQLPASS